MEPLVVLFRYLTNMVSEELKLVYLEYVENILLIDKETNLEGDLQDLLMSEVEGSPDLFLSNLNSLFFDYLFQLTKQMGVSWNEDMLEPTDITLMNDIANTLLLTDGAEDTGELADIFNNDEMGDIDKFVAIVSVITCKPQDELLSKIVYVNPDMLLGIHQALYIPETTPELNMYIISRIKLNIAPEDTDNIAYQYLLARGGLGVNFESLMNLHKAKLDQKIGTPLEWFENVKAIALLSDLPNSKVTPAILGLCSQQFEDFNILRDLKLLSDKIQFEVI